MTHLAASTFDLFVSSLFFFREIAEEMKRQWSDVCALGVTCPICWFSCTLPCTGTLERFATPSTAMLCCCTTFCYDCLHAWVEHDTSCPTCRSSLAGMVQPYNATHYEAAHPSCKLLPHVLEFFEERQEQPSNAYDDALADGTRVCEEDIVIGPKLTVHFALSVRTT